MDCRNQIETVLNESNVLNEVKTSMLNVGLHVENLPNDTIVHFAYGHQGHDKDHKLVVDAREIKKALQELEVQLVSGTLCTKAFTLINM